MRIWTLSLLTFATLMLSQFIPIDARAQQLEITCISYTTSASGGWSWSGQECFITASYESGYDRNGRGSVGGGGGSSSGPPPYDSIHDQNNDGLTDCWKNSAMGDHNLDSSDDWGPRTHPITGAITHHNGIDIQGTLGTSIHSIANGVITSVVASSTATTGNGAHVRMRYDYGGKTFEAVYLHLNNSSTTVSTGNTVIAGQPLAEMNSTGGSTGDHLHLTIYEVANNGAKTDIDPAAHLGGKSCSAN